MSKIRTVIFRGDEYAYAQRQSDDGFRFPYVDHAAAAGAGVIHIWFWGDEFRSVSNRFFAYCRDRGLSVSLGLGVGAYGVADGEDPTDVSVLGRVKDTVSRIIEVFPISGIELQNGEYDDMEYKRTADRYVNADGECGPDLSRGHQVADELNPVIEHALHLRPDLEVRTELNADRFADPAVEALERSLDPRCIVEWSRFTGPYRGTDAFERGRRLLSKSRRFGLFLKLYYHSDLHFRESMKDDSRESIAQWIEHWRGWIRLLEMSGRSDLTVCNVSSAYVDSALPLPAAAVALARDSDVMTDELIDLFFT